MKNLVTGLAILVPAERSRRNCISFTFQGQGGVYFDLHFFRGKTRPQEVPFIDYGWNCRKTNIKELNTGSFKYMEYHGNHTKDHLTRKQGSNWSIFYVPLSSRTQVSILWKGSVQIQNMKKSIIHLHHYNIANEANIPHRTVCFICTKSPDTVWAWPSKNALYRSLKGLIKRTKDNQKDTLPFKIQKQTTKQKQNPDM